MEERIARLEKVLKEIKEHERMGGAFDELHQLIKDQYRLEGGESNVHKMNEYGFNLECIIRQEVQDYKSEKRKGLKRGAPSELRTFVTAFQAAVEDEIRHIQIQGNSI